MNRGDRGSVTVLLTLILIPTIILVSMFTDLARIKLYSNQVLMGADNYAEGVLKEYDNFLKEMYGLFAISQSEEGKNAIETINDYMKSSFDINHKSISFSHLQGTSINQGNTFEGYIPYKGADLNFEIYPVQGYELSNNKVLGNQISDFMRYRVIKEIAAGEGEKDFLDVLEEVNGTKEKMEVVKEKSEIDKKVGELFEKLKEYYEILKDIKTFKGYLKDVNKAYEVTLSGNSTVVERNSNSLVEVYNSLGVEDYKYGILGIVLSSDYSDYLSYMDEKIEERKVLENIAFGDENTEEDSTDIVELERKAEEERQKNEIKNKMQKAAGEYQRLFHSVDGYREHKVKFEQYKTKSQELFNKSVEINDLVLALSSRVSDFKEKLESKESEFNKNIAESLKLTEKLTENPQSYTEIAEIFIGNNGLIDGFRSLKEEMQKQVDEELIGVFLNGLEQLEEENIKKIREEITNRRYLSKRYNIEISTYKDIESNDVSQILKDLDKNLDETFNQENENKKKIESGKDSIEKKAIEDLKKEDDDFDSNKLDGLFPRDIKIDMGNNASASSFRFGSISDLTSIFTGDGIEGLATKVLTMYYDYGMFSDRIDLYKYKENRSNVKVSYTGYDMTKLNYLFGAELEYLCAGYQSSKENWKSVRNKIFLFRGAMNILATYQITELNTAIINLAALTGPFAPITDPAIRIGIIIAETAADWERLQKNERILVLKTKISDLSSFDYILNTFGLELINDIEEEQDTKNKINYKQCVGVILILLVDKETLISRTGDLISLNMTHAKEGEDFSELTFKMKEAQTMVRAIGGIKMKYFFLPDGFGGGKDGDYEVLTDYTKATLPRGTYLQMKEVENLEYRYSIIRGY